MMQQGPDLLLTFKNAGRELRKIKDMKIKAINPIIFCQVRLQVV